MKTPSLKIGITGGIGTGKTLISSIFKVMGIPVYDADSRAKWLMAYDPDLGYEVRSLLGDRSFIAEGKPDTAFIAAAVFGNETLLEKLNAIVHPAVGKDFEAWAMEHHSAPYVLKEAALLYESGSYHSLDRIIVVASPIELRLKRLQARDPQRSPEQILSIIDRQLPDAEKISRADDVLYNDGQHMIIPQVLALHEKYLRAKS